jgi:hypothetical protein
MQWSHITGSAFARQLKLTNNPAFCSKEKAGAADFYARPWHGNLPATLPEHHT